jgi:hypothetical protein
MDKIIRALIRIEEARRIDGKEILLFPIITSDSFKDGDVKTGILSIRFKGE